LVLLDQPYGFEAEAWGAVLDALAARHDIAMVVIESSHEIAIDQRWDAIRSKWYGGTLLTILRPSNPPSHDQQLEPT
jgi:16S rRNA G966 N2-methylase RsmD